ncbi:OmpP1/FadL family transporter [Pseudomonas sp. 008]|jgi:long-chain fatty acid transport protein|uniref:OmpP1/FadL family transporter n=1 Tax=Pseudomonas sp. 008 TaxID=2803906 RepID=UPI0019518EE7|nr:outer membrane protein transport protein [Pseudomonas sp. 008]
MIIYSSIEVSFFSVAVTWLKAHLQPGNVLSFCSGGLRKGLASLAILGYSTISMANGLALNEQSASNAGTAYAGRSSSALDSSTVYGNPAGLSKLKNSQVSNGFALVDVAVDITNASSSASGTNKGDSVPLTAIPFGYFSVPVDERFTFGLGLYGTYGLVNNYESSFQGRYHGSYSKVQVKTLNPAIAFRVNDRLSLGGGLTVNRIENQLESFVDTGALNNGKDTKIKVKGNDTAIGYNLGLLIDLTESTTWGITYHSKIDFHVKGKTRISESPAAFGLDGNYNNKLDETMPESIDTSFTHHFDDRWTGYIGATWTRWSRIQRVEALNRGLPVLGQQLGFDNTGDDFKLHNTLAGAVGLSYQLSSKWLLRTGYAYDPSPARNSHRNVRLPVGNRNAIAIGAAFSPSRDWTVDIAYGYLRESSTTVNQANTNGAQPSYKAEYNNSAHIVAAQLTYKF